MTTYEKYENAKVNGLKAIYFDMDGTIADLYGVENWLTALKNEETTPYEEAKPMFDPAKMEAVITALKKEGYLIGVISFTAWGCTKDYGRAIRRAKKEWLRKFFPFADIVHITNNKREKVNIVKIPRGYLLDDEDRNVRKWTDKNCDRVGVKVNGNVVEMLEAIANGAL